ncbi:PREDICTED: uncharacterized protein LOC109151883 [Ipomoea nil]|uniref:uncharacterized protein LOC109151883 n=1 Tax=Ipomoea nil TaxID=35883 RepID=UPI000901D825|nr:PREDICTED: uncharacterized protein LOC109151883 [Ipomoea nil]
MANVKCPLPSEDDDFAAWFSRCLTCGDSTLVMKCVLICWCIWKGRNELVWNNKVWQPSLIQNEVANTFVEWQGEATLVESEEMHGQNINTLPGDSPGTMNIYVDATVFGDTDEAYFGVFVVDSNGEFVAVKNGPIRCLSDVHLAEALAVKEALSWVKELGLTKVIIYSDCKNVCRLLNGTSQDLSYAGCVIRECRSFQRHFDLVSFHYVSRSVNRFAHALARATRSQTGSSCWLISFPSCIEHLR